MVEELQPRALLLANLFRDQLDRYGELDTIADRWAAVVAERARSTQLVLNADDPLVADLGARPRAEPVVLRRRGRRASPTPSSSTPRTPSTAAAAGTPTSTRPPTWATSAATTAPTAATAAPSPPSPPSPSQLRGIRSAAFTLRAPTGSTRVELPLPGLYNVYNALGAAALCLSLGVELPTIAAGLGAVEPAFGRAETIDLDGRATSILLIKNPAGANEVLRTLALEGGELDLFGVLNDRIADGRDVSWVWDADWETLAPHVKRMTCSGTRAAELALRLKYAGVPTERLEVVDGLAGRPRPRARGRQWTALRPAHLHRAAGAARPAQRARAGGALLAMSAIVWHDVECGGYAADLRAVARAGGRRGRPGARRRRGRRARRARSRAPRPRRHRAGPRSRAARRARRPRRPAGVEVRTVHADAAGFELAGPPFGLILAPMQTIQLLPGRAARAAFLASAREHLAAGGLRRAGARRGAWSRSRPTPRTRCRPTPRERDGWRYRSFPVAIRPRGDRVVLERVRELIAPDGTRSMEDDAISLTTLSAARPRGRGPRLRAAPGAAAPDRRDRRPPRLDGGDAAWLTASCGSARSTRTS